MNVDQQVVDILQNLANRNDQLERGVVTLIEEVVKLREAVALQTHLPQRHIGYAADAAAAKSSAAYAQRHFPTAPALPGPAATLRRAAELTSVDGMVLEFGVASGTSLRLLVDALPGRAIYGFDVFSGLPEDWRTGYLAGAFAQEPPRVPGAELVVGLFEHTLPGFLATHPGPVAFVHADADLYSSTVTVLEHVGPRLVAGSVILFDEYFNYPAWEQHEHRAWQEYVQQSGIEFSYEGYTVDHEQVIVRVVKPGR